MAIGLTLAPIAIHQATMNEYGPYQALVTVVTICIVSIFTRGVFQRLPVIFGIIIGYLFTLILSIFQSSAQINYQAVNEAPWFGFPSITYPTFEGKSIGISFDS